MNVEQPQLSTVDGISIRSETKPSSLFHWSDVTTKPPDTISHVEGIWVTMVPARMSSSPFFDTLLVLVVSPLVTLTIVYALLLLRTRLRRRRWRAPKSVVESLPVRIYHSARSETSSCQSGHDSPKSISATTPLLHPSLRTSNVNVPTYTGFISELSDDNTTTGMQQVQGQLRPTGTSRGDKSKKRRFYSKHRECAVCLDEYVDGVSRVMSLPCRHEFHVECM